MSFILDALKKSEKERQRKALPDILTVQDIVAEKRHRPRYWVYLLAAALLLNASILSWWMAASSKGEKNTLHTANVDTAARLSANVVTPAVTERIEPSPDSLPPISPQLPSAEKEKVPAATKIMPVRTDREPDLRVKAEEPPNVGRKAMFDHSEAVSETNKPAAPAPVIEKQPVESVAIPPVQASLPTEVPDMNRIYKLKDLPPTILQGLPTFSVSALLYAENPSSRMVRVNEQMMHEGENLAQGVRLEEITKDGLVFSYRKYRFYVGTK